MTVDYKYIIRSGNLPRRFLVRYALACAKAVNVNSKDLNALKCIELTEKWLLDDKSVSSQELLDAAAAVYAATYASYAAHAARAAANVAANANAARATTAYATYAAAHAASKSFAFNPTELLINMIKEEFSNTEMILMGINQGDLR